MADNNNFGNVIGSLISGVEGVLSTKTVVGEAVTIGDTIILPLVDVSFGIGAGANTNSNKNGGFGGVNAKMTPSAVLVIKDGYTKLVNIKNQDTFTKLLDLLPDLIDRFGKKDIDISDHEAKDIAFPEDLE